MAHKLDNKQGRDFGSPAITEWRRKVAGILSPLL